MANTLLTPTWVLRETAMAFTSSLRGVAQFDRSYSDEYVQSGAKVGDTVKVRLPNLFEASEGEGLVEQNLVDRTVNVVLNRRRHVGFGWSTAQATLELQDARERYINPAAEVLASVYDRVSLGDVYKAVWNAVGTPGTTPNALITYGYAKVKIQDFGGPDTGLKAVLDPYSHLTIADALKALFHPGSLISSATRNGEIASEAIGISNWYTDQNIPKFTTGACAAASTPLVNGAGQTGSSIVTDGWGAASAPVKGDIVTFSGVYAVNPLSKESTGRLHQFVLTATPTAGTDITLSISPSIVTSGAYQNVTAAPADNATVTYWSMAAGGTMAATVSPQNLVFHPKAFASVMADLTMPEGGAEGTRVSSKLLNVSIRMVKQYGIQDDRNRSRLDILFGSAPIQERLACRVAA